MLTKINKDRMKERFSAYLSRDNACPPKNTLGLLAFAENERVNYDIGKVGSQTQRRSYINY